MKIAIVTDAWTPQTNGVVKTLLTTAHFLEQLGHQVLIIEPSHFRTFPCPTYPEIRLAFRPLPRIARMLKGFEPDAIHIATEGTLGMAARRYCLRAKLPFTTSYHTQFPEYVRARAPIPLVLSYAHLRRFHGAAERTMVATASMQRQLEARGFSRLARWSRGVDVKLFRPQSTNLFDLPKPISMYMGRVAVEKNVSAFLSLVVSGTKVVVGDGPARADLQRKHPDVVFTGYKFGEELAEHLAAADVFVFPSRTDTFGLVLLEALACGVPVAAYPVTGPIDLIEEGVTGALDDDLAKAHARALKASSEACRAFALQHTWENATAQFLSNLVPIEKLTRTNAAAVTAGDTLAAGLSREV